MWVLVAPDFQTARVFGIWTIKRVEEKQCIFDVFSVTTFDWFEFNGSAIYMWKVVNAHIRWIVSFSEIVQISIIKFRAHCIGAIFNRSMCVNIILHGFRIRCVKRRYRWIASFQNWSNWVRSVGAQSNFIVSWSRVFKWNVWNWLVLFCGRMVLLFWWHPLITPTEVNRIKKLYSSFIENGRLASV